MIYDVSVIVLTHNRLEGLMKTLDSVFSQTYLNYEVILVDNGSEEGYLSNLPDTYLAKNNFDILRFNENESPAKRYNQAALVSRGNYLIFLTDDCYWCPEALDELANAVRTGVDLVTGKVKTLDCSTGYYIPNNFGNFEWKRGCVKKVNPIHLTSAIISKDMFDDIGGFNESYKKLYSLDFWNRVYHCDKYVTGVLDEFISHLEINHNEGLSNCEEVLDISDFKSPNPLRGSFSKRFFINTYSLDESINKKGYNLIVDNTNSYPKFDDIDNIGDICLTKNDLYKTSEEGILKLSDATVLKNILIHLGYKLSSYQSQDCRNIYKSYKVNHNKGGNWVRVSSDTKISQYVRILKDDVFSEIGVFLNLSQYYTGILNIELIYNKKNYSYYYPNDSLFHGWNLFKIEDLEVKENSSLVINFKVDQGSLAMECAPVKGILGVMLVNRKPVKACLRYRLN